MNFLNQITFTNLLSDTMPVYETVLIVLGSILLFFISVVFLVWGTYLIINGYRNDNVLRIIIGVLLTGFFGLLVLFILYLAEPKQRRKRSPSKKSAKGKTDKK